jgi:hypothetical protein
MVRARDRVGWRTIAVPDLFRLMMFGHAGPIDLPLRHAPNMLDVRPGSGIAFAKCGRTRRANLLRSINRPLRRPRKAWRGRDAHRRRQRHGEEIPSFYGHIGIPSSGFAAKCSQQSHKNCPQSDVAIQNSFACQQLPPLWHSCGNAFGIRARSGIGSIEQLEISERRIGPAAGGPAAGPVRASLG